MSRTQHPSRRTVLGGGAAGLAGLAGSTGLAGCGSGPRAAGDIAFWGAGGDDLPAQTRFLDAWTAANPGTRITASQVPAGSLNYGASIITAVRGGTAPDVWLLDRFTTAQYAALGLLEPLDPLVEENTGLSVEEFRSGWLRFAVDEASYDGKLYALPTETDCRVLFYNKTMLREAGVDPDELDPANGPVTFDRVLDMADAVTRRDARGNYERLGWIPWSDEGWPMTYSFARGATYFDDSTCSVDLLADPVLHAYEQLEEWRDRLDFAKVDLFLATYQPASGPPSANTVFTGRRAFVTATPWWLSQFAKYAPDLDVGVTHLPVNSPGDRPYTWSGGFAVATPKGSSRSKEVWDFMTSYAGADGQRALLGELKRLPTRVDVLSDPSASDPSLRFFADELQHSTSRPPLPAAQVLWDATVDAKDAVLYSRTPAREALQRAQDRVEPQMSPYCPFRLPEGFGTVGV
ncbi:ABC transporter substrate-binding protein [Kineococcus sp. DHX-1]|uniref:ABC transporter substrate-binding protein n=1 Tax=Kineococcus sp. DHX-1 TaxID=3349638 RepID=UPI0036D41C83